MLYLLVQIALLLLVTAAIFFALGAVFHRKFLRQEEPAQASVSVAAGQIQELRAKLKSVQAQLKEKEEALELLSREPDPAPAPPVEVMAAAVAPAPVEVAEQATSAEPEGEEARMLDQMTALQSALEAQGAILENKTAALERTKAQQSRLQEENEFLAQRLKALESEIEELRSRPLPEPEPPAPVDAEALWANEKSEPSPELRELERQLAVQEETILTLTQLAEEKEKEALILQARVEELSYPPESETTRPDISLEAMQAFWQPADLEKALAERDQIEARLKAQIAELEEKLQHQDKPRREWNPSVDAELALVASHLEAEPQAEESAGEDFEEKIAELYRKLDAIEKGMREGERQLQSQIENKFEQIGFEVSDLEKLLRERPPWFENELLEKHKLIETLSEAAEQEHEEERKLRVLVDELRQLLTEKDALLLKAHTELERLSAKIDPELVGDDNLQLINGVGPYVKKLLKEHFSITSFRQIALLTSEEIEGISKKLFFSGKIQRENWIEQAISLHFKKYGEHLKNPEARL